jgi:hypothetical protein
MTGNRSIAAGFQRNIGGAGWISAGCLLSIGGDPRFHDGYRGKTGGCVLESAGSVAFDARNGHVAADFRANVDGDVSMSAGWKRKTGQNALVSAGVPPVAGGFPHDAAGYLS